MSKFGATGRFPRGKFSQHDEGELQIGVTHKDKTVLLNFGKPVAWLGFDADTAIALGNTLLEHAAECKKP